MNSKKMIVLLFSLILYVNYVMHFKKDIPKLERSIVNNLNRTLKEERLFKEKDQYKDINSSKDYSYLFYDGNKLPYSSAMGELQQFIQSSAKEAHCKLLNTQWQDMPSRNDKKYDVLSLKLFFNCEPKEFIIFANLVRKKSKLLVFTQLRLLKNRRKNFLTISTTLYAYRSKKNEK